jgi:hypothetical protein
MQAAVNYAGGSKLTNSLNALAPTRRRLRLGNGTPSSKLTMAASLADMVAAAGQLQRATAITEPLN